jgi:hypothetical protein
VAHARARQVGNNLKDQQLQQIVDKTIMEADRDGDGKLSFEEFALMVSNTVRRPPPHPSPPAADTARAGYREADDARGPVLIRMPCSNIYVCIVTVSAEHGRVSTRSSAPDDGDLRSAARDGPRRG